MFTKHLIILLAAPLLLTGLYLAAFNIADHAGLNIRTIPFQALHTYQMEKAADTDAKLAFVGDSALGNAINARLFTGLSGIPSANFALTGAFGYVGTSKMVKHLHRSRGIKTFIIMQTPGMPGRSVAKDYTPRRWLQTDGFKGIDLSILNFTSLRFFALSMVKHIIRGNATGTLIVNDYVRQKAPIDPAAIAGPGYSPEAIKDDKLDQLSAITNYCTENGLRCLYVHGPALEHYCRTGAPYFAALEEKFAARAIPLAAPNPLCIPPEKIGDADDHVHPAYKDEYTRRYFTLLKPYLDLEN